MKTLNRDVIQSLDEELSSLIMRVHFKDEILAGALGALKKNLITGLNTFQFYSEAIERRLEK